MFACGNLLLNSISFYFMHLGLLLLDTFSMIIFPQRIDPLLSNYVPVCPWQCALFKSLIFFSFLFFFFLFFRATPEAYGSSQARGAIRAVAACLHHSNGGSEPSLRLNTTAQGNARCLTHWERLRVWTRILMDARSGLLTTEPQQELFMDPINVLTQHVWDVIKMLHFLQVPLWCHCWWRCWSVACIWAEDNLPHTSSAYHPYDQKLTPSQAVLHPLSGTWPSLGLKIYLTLKWPLCGFLAPH